MILILWISARSNVWVGVKISMGPDLIDTMSGELLWRVGAKSAVLCQIRLSVMKVHENDALQQFGWRILRCFWNVGSHRLPIKALPREFVLQGFGERTLGRRKGKPEQKVHMNKWARELFATTVQVSGADQVVTTQPEKHRWGVNAGCVVRQPKCTSTMLQPR